MYAFLPTITPQTKVMRIHDAEDRRLLYRGWSRLLLHAAKISAVTADRATAKANVASATVSKTQREKMDPSSTEVATATSVSGRASRQSSRASEEAMELKGRLEEAEPNWQGGANRRLGRLVRTLSCCL